MGVGSRVITKYTGDGISIRPSTRGEVSPDDEEILAIRQLTRAEFYNFMFRSQKLKAAITQFIISHKINCIEHENTTYLECERFAEVIGCPILPKYKTDIDGRQYVDFQYVSHLCNSHYKEDQHDNTYADVVQADKEFSALLEKIHATRF